MIATRCAERLRRSARIRSRARRIGFCSLLVLSSGAVRAEWVAFGAAAKCSPETSSFELLPVAKTENPAYTVNAPVGAHELPTEWDQHYECRLGAIIIRMNFGIFGPQGRGQGQGTGGVIISRLELDGVEVIATPTNFNWQPSLNEPTLTRIRLIATSSTRSATHCYGKGFAWDKPYAGERCETKGVER